MKRVTNILLFGVLLPLYAVLFFYALLFKNVPPQALFDPAREITRELTLAPFQTIRMYLTTFSNPIIALTNIVGNIALFVPLGLYLQLLMKDKCVIKAALIVLAATVTAEALQYALGLGRADVDDIILNFLGGLIGIFGYRILKALLKDEDKVRALIVITAATLILAVVLVPRILGIQLRLI